MVWGLVWANVHGMVWRMGKEMVCQLVEGKDWVIGLKKGLENSSLNGLRNCSRIGLWNDKSLTNLSGNGLGNC